MARVMQTYAPQSHYRQTDEFIQPTLGSGVEILVAWNERIIASHHFQKKGEIKLGSQIDCDVVVPLNHFYKKNLSLVKIDHVVEVNVPLGMKSILSQKLEGETQEKTLEMSESKLILGQNEMLSIYLSDQLKIIVRLSQQSVPPKLIPFVDLSSDGFLSLAFATIVAVVTALLVKLNPPMVNQHFAEDFYPTPLIIQSPERVARFLMPQKTKVDLQKKNLKPSQSLLREKRVNKLAKQKQSPGNKIKASALKKNNHRSKKTVGSKVGQGGSVKMARKQGAQAKSQSLKNSKIFSVLSAGGRRKNLDKEYDGPGQLAGLANLASNSVGESASREGLKFGSRFRQAHSDQAGKSNVGVAGLGQGNGLGRGFGYESLGQRKSVAIVPGGQGVVVSGNIDRDGIRQIFFDNARAIRSCYERVLNQKTQLAGKLVVNFDIAAGGRVVGSPRVDTGSSTIANTQLSRCVLNKLRTWRFPDPPTGQVVNVLYPLAFSSR